LLPEGLLNNTCAHTKYAQVYSATSRAVSTGKKLVGITTDHVIAAARE
jgi:hypothetical protein